MRPTMRPSLAALSGLALLALLAVGAAPAAAEPTASLVGRDTAARLARGEEVRASSSGSPAALSLAPAHPGASGLASAVAAEAPDIVVEALFHWPRPRALDPAAEALAAYNVLRAVGSLEGIEYYSASRGRMRVLYESSSLVAGPGDDRPARDERLGALPPGGETLYARQKDTTFGDHRYRLTLSSGAGFVAQSSTNLTRMSLGPVPVAAPGAVNVRLLVLSVDDGLLLYVASSAKAAVMPGVRGALERSFGNRAAAAFAWFSREMARAYPAAP